MSTWGFEGVGRRRAPVTWKHVAVVVYAVLGLVIAALGTVMLSDLPWKQVFVHIQARDWPTAPGKVIAVSLHEEWRAGARGFETELVLGVTYRYTVGDVSIEAPRASFSDRAGPDDRRLRRLYRQLDFARITGRTVAVAYDPHNPGSAYLDRSFDWRAALPRAGIGIAALLFGFSLTRRLWHRSA